MHNLHNNESMCINYVKYVTCIKCIIYSSSDYVDSDERRNTTRPGSVRIQHESPGRPGFWPWTVQLMSWYHLYSRRFPAKDEEDLKDLDALGKQ